MEKLYQREDYNVVLDYDAKGFYNPPYRLTIKNSDKTSFLLGAGLDDDVTVFTECRGSDRLYFILSVNHSLPYLGLEIFDIHGETAGDMFLQEDFRQEEVVGRKWEDKSDMWLVKRMYDHIAV